MKNTAIIFILLFILTGCGMQKRNPISSAGEIGFLTEACFKDECFSVEIADTIKKRHLGLMYHENLAPQSGMLFIFPTVDKHNFWMKNTLIPLDIIWLDAKQKVVFISENAKPCEIKNCPNITPDKEALYILEVNAGVVEKINLEVGDEVTFTSNPL